MNTPTKQHTSLILAIYLIGLFTGGIYVGAVAPVRVVVQSGFGIGDTAGIWMISIYTLFYAAFIPVIGKIADMFGAKPVFIACLATFGTGATLCGVSQITDMFAVLLAGRALQAIGACGMIPVANAQIATTFPPERRGVALGLAAAASGIANVFGAAVGSAILSLCGAQNWPILFYLSVPVCILLAIGALIFIPATPSVTQTHVDFVGAVVFISMIVALLLGFNALDFTDARTFAEVSVWGPFVGTIVLGVAFGQIERHAKDPIFHLEYFNNHRIVIIMLASFCIGATTIALTLVPETAEYVMGLPAGSGGYYLVALAALTVVGPIVAGKLIDKIGPKLVLFGGLATTALGYCLLMVVIASAPAVAPNNVVFIACLALVGLGMGFSLGAPANYMILENTPEGQSTAALATIALVRHIGTTIAPLVYVAIIAAGADAGSSVGIVGYQNMLLCTAGFAFAGAVIVAFYRKA